MATDIYMKNPRGRRASLAENAPFPRGRRSSVVAIAYSGGEDAGKRRRPSLIQVVDGLSIVTVIRKKRDGEELSDSEIEWFVTAATDSLITEAQIGMV